MSGLKIKNKPKEKTPSQADFQEAVAKDIQNKIEKANNTREALFKLGSALKELFENKELNINKSSVQVKNERQSIASFLEVIQEIDMDDREECNAGTYGALALLINTLLKQRDRINELEYTLKNK